MNFDFSAKKDFYSDASKGAITTETQSVSYL